MNARQDQISGSRLPPLAAALSGLNVLTNWNAGSWVPPAPRFTSSLRVADLELERQGLFPPPMPRG